MFLIIDTTFVFQSTFWEDLPSAIWVAAFGISCLVMKQSLNNRPTVQFAMILVQFHVPTVMAEAIMSRMEKKSNAIAVKVED